MRKIMILTLALSILAVFLIAGCTQTKPIVGGDKDEHGCIPSAGYTWCEAKQKCLREWEEPCKEEGTKLNYCTEKDKNVEVCTAVFQPVCGKADDGPQCYTEPCAITYPNACMACRAEEVILWVEGECP